MLNEKEIKEEIVLLKDKISEKKKIILPLEEESKKIQSALDNKFGNLSINVTLNAGLVNSALLNIKRWNIEITIYERILNNKRMALMP